MTKIEDQLSRRVKKMIVVTELNVVKDHPKLVRNAQRNLQLPVAAAVVVVGRVPMVFVHSKKNEYEKKCSKVYPIDLLEIVVVVVVEYPEETCLAQHLWHSRVLIVDE